VILSGDAGQSSLVSGPRTELEGGALVATAADRLAQEDTRRFEWTARAAVRLEPIGDASPAVDAAGLALEIVYAVDTAPATPVRLRLDCGEPCREGLDISQGLDVAAGKGWRTGRLDLSCFTAAGVGLPSYRGGMMIEAEGGLVLTISAVRLVSTRTAAGCEL
jgi:beta-glucosidase